MEKEFLPFTSYFHLTWKLCDIANYAKKQDFIKSYFQPSTALYD